MHVTLFEYVLVSEAFAGLRGLLSHQKTRLCVKADLFHLATSLPQDRSALSGVAQ